MGGRLMLAAFLPCLALSCSGKSPAEDSGFTSSEDFDAWVDDLVAERTVDVGGANVIWSGSKDHQFSELVTSPGGEGQVILEQYPDFYVLDELPLVDCDPIAAASGTIRGDVSVTQPYDRYGLQDQLGDLDGDGAMDFVFDTDPLGMTLFFGRFSGDISALEPDALFYDRPPKDPNDEVSFTQLEIAVGELEAGGPKSIAVVGWDSRGDSAGVAHLLTEAPQATQWVQDAATATLLETECHEEETRAGDTYCEVKTPLGSPTSAM
jgi:hypothetical protein